MFYFVLSYSMLVFPLTSFAPNAPAITFIETAQPIRLSDQYESLAKAVFHWETRGSMDTLSYNQKENACGPFQIRPCRLEHYNSLTGKNYTLQDMYDFNKAKEVFLYFATHDNRGRLVLNKPFELVAKNWNGSGPMTEGYWAGVRDVLYKFYS